MRGWSGGGRRGLLAAAVCLLLALFACGCFGKEGTEEKTEDLEFTVVGDAEIPQELRGMIEEKKEEPFRLTYSSGGDLYIASGYGKQESGGYSISVLECYLTENSIVVKTELKGPQDGEQTGTQPSYPFLVIRTELIEKPVVFQ